MTKREENAIRWALDNAMNREDRLAHDFITLNPGHASERQRDAQLVKMGMMMLYDEILKELKK